jgi:hypothetical protein
MYDASSKHRMSVDSIDDQILQYSLNSLTAHKSQPIALSLFFNRRNHHSRFIVLAIGVFLESGDFIPVNHTLQEMCGFFYVFSMTTGHNVIISFDLWHYILGTSTQ